MSRGRGGELGALQDHQAWVKRGEGVPNEQGGMEGDSARSWAIRPLGCGRVGQWAGKQGKRCRCKHGSGPLGPRRLQALGVITHSQVAAMTRRSPVVLKPSPAMSMVTTVSCPTASLEQQARKWRTTSSYTERFSAGRVWRLWAHGHVVGAWAWKHWGVRQWGRCLSTARTRSTSLRGALGHEGHAGCGAVGESA